MLCRSKIEDRSNVLRALLIEDNAGDARLVKESLAEIEEPQFELQWTKKLSEGLELLANMAFDVILLDLSLPDSHGFETITRVHEKVNHIPLIVLTGLDDEAMGIKAVREGAQDYLVKGTVESSILCRIIRYAIERKRIEEALRVSQDKLRKKNQEILEFTDVVTHDLKKPLATIKTIHSLIEKEAMCKLAEDGHEAIQTQSQAISYMQELLEDLLACARLEAGTQKMEKEEFDVSEVIQTVVERFKYQIREKNINVAANAEAKIFADKKGITKVFMNLIGNAISYIGEGLERRITIGHSLENGQHILSVRDTGVGIPDKMQKTVFDKFERGSNVQGIDGTGLGLSIVKATVEAHGGRVWLKSKENEGTTILFSLPPLKKEKV